MVDAHRLFERLLGPALPLVIISAVTGGTALVLLRRADPRLLRVLAAVAVGAVVTGWGVAQYPYLLGTHLRISDAAAPRPTLVVLMVVFAGAVVLCVPSLALLYFFLEQRGELEAT